MKWLLPDEEKLVRRMRRGPGSFGRNEMATLEQLTKRGLLTEETMRCPDCGFHDVKRVRFTERGKIVVMILDALSSKPDLLT